MCILDAPNFKSYRRNHRKPTGMWCGALVQTEDAGLCWMTYKFNKGKWCIYTEKLLTEWATYRQLPADTPLHEVVSDILIESMDQDGILFRCPESPDTLYQPLGSELSRKSSPNRAPKPLPNPFVPAMSYRSFQAFLFKNSRASAS